MKNFWFEWGIGAASAVLIGAGLVVVGASSRSVEATSLNTKDNAADARLLLASMTSADQLERALSETRRASIQRNETLSGVLDRIGAPRDQANGAVLAAGQLIDLRRVRPGDDVTAWLSTDDDSGAVRLVGLSLRPDVERQVLVSQNSAGQWVTHELRTQLTPGYNRVAGTIQQSIYQAALALGAGDQQVVDFADILGYDIDFQRETQAGDEFEIFYETFDDERGQPVKAGAILYAEMNGQALKKGFYRFTPSDDGQVDYFDDKGQSAKKFLMKTPINGARLSSSFGNRKHPILGYTKLHKGTDFAAPTGTPIYAAGSGVITYKGYNGGYGNYIKVQHANGYETAYAHMSRYATGAAKGTRVRQGQIIGYVGSTGASTGPHLHYEVYVNKKPVNAMALKLPTGRKLEGPQLEAFNAEKARIDALRNGGGNEGLTFVAGTQLEVAPGAETAGVVATPIAAAASTPETRPGSTAN